ncbi:hypothetical protein RAG05_05725, partial [Klebsiella pneumoniae]
SVRLVVLVGLAIDQIAQSGLSSLSVIYYSAQLFSRALSPRDLSTPAAPNPVDNLEAVAWQPQPGRATGSRSFFEQGKLPRRAAR